MEMEEKTELQRQARERARAVTDRIQAERDNKLGEAIAGAQALEKLQVMLEAVGHELRILADRVDKPELSLLIRDRQNLDDLMRVTRKGRVLTAKPVHGPLPTISGADVFEVYDGIYEQLAKRVLPQNN